MVVITTISAKQTLYEKFFKSTFLSRTRSRNGRNPASIRAISGLHIDIRIQHDNRRALQ